MARPCALCRQPSHDEYGKHFLHPDGECPSHFEERMEELWDKTQRDYSFSRAVNMFRELRRGWAKSARKGWHPDARRKLDIINRVYQGKTH